MSRISAVREWLASKIAPPRAQYEAARQWSRDRSYLHGWVQDARFDQPEPVRTELVRKSRYWERNDPITNRLADVWEQYTVGANGLIFTPATSSEAFNEAAREAWNRWSDLCDIGSRHTLSAVQSLASYRWFWDGEMTILKTRGATGRPRIQLLECNRIASPPDAAASPFLHDGVEVDGNGRPLRYWIANDWEGTKYRPIDSAMVIRIMEPSRPGQLRGFPITTPVLNKIHDFDDLQVLEMRGAKGAARYVWHYKRKDGTVVDREALRRTRVVGVGETSTGAVTSEQKDRSFSDVVGGESFATDIDEDVKLLSSNRPSVASQQYWDWGISGICAGIGIPKLLAFPYSLQGTVTRADLDVCSSFFRARSSVLIAAFRQVYEYVIGAELEANVALARLAPRDWNKVNVRPPRSPNVDVGRNSTAMLAELKAGIRTLDSCISEMGYDWKDFAVQKVTEAKFIRELAAREGLPPSDVSDILAAAIVAPGARSEDEYSNSHVITP